MYASERCARLLIGRASNQSHCHFRRADKSDMLMGISVADALPIIFNVLNRLIVIYFIEVCCHMCRINRSDVSEIGFRLHKPRTLMQSLGVSLSPSNNKKDRQIQVGNCW